MATNETIIKLAQKLIGVIDQITTLAADGHPPKDISDYNTKMARLGGEVNALAFNCGLANEAEPPYDSGMLSWSVSRTVKYAAVALGGIEKLFPEIARLYTLRAKAKLLVEKGSVKQESEHNANTFRQKAIELFEQVIGELEDWEKKYLPDNPQAGKIELLDIVNDRQLKSVVSRIEWNHHQPEADKVKAECTKILQWFRTGDGVLSQNLEDNPFVANEKGFSLKLTSLLRDIAEMVREGLETEKPAEPDGGNSIFSDLVTEVFCLKPNDEKIKVLLTVTLKLNTILKQCFQDHLTSKAKFLMMGYQQSMRRPVKELVDSLRLSGSNNCEVAAKIIEEDSTKIWEVPLEANMGLPELLNMQNLVGDFILSLNKIQNDYTQKPAGTEQGCLQEIIKVIKNWQKSEKTDKDLGFAKSSLPPIAKTYDILCRCRSQCGAKTANIISWLGIAATNNSGYYPAFLDAFAEPEVIADIESWLRKPTETGQDVNKARKKKRPTAAEMKIRNKAVTMAAAELQAKYGRLPSVDEIMNETELTTDQIYATAPYKEGKIAKKSAKLTTESTGGSVTGSEQFGEKSVEHSRANKLSETEQLERDRLIDESVADDAKDEKQHKHYLHNKKRIDAERH